MDLENKHLAAGLICEKMFDPIETIVEGIMKNMDGGEGND